MSGRPMRKPKKGGDLCADCLHDRAYHNASGCGIEQCGCQEFTRTPTNQRRTDGGPAFPSGKIDVGSEWANYPYLGMSMRDHFAALAMGAIVSTIRNEEDYVRLIDLAKFNSLDKVSQWIARESYRQADAMIAERAK